MFILLVSAKDTSKVKSPLDRLFEKEGEVRYKRVGGRELEEIGGFIQRDVYTQYG